MFNNNVLASLVYFLLIIVFILVALIIYLNFVYCVLCLFVRLFLFVCSVFLIPKHHSFCI